MTKNTLELVKKHFSDLGDSLLSGNSAVLIIENIVKETTIPSEVEYAQKYIADCNKDIGFMGSPEYYKQKKIVDDYFEPIKAKQQEDKEREDYIRLKSKFETA